MSDDYFELDNKAKNKKSVGFVIGVVLGVLVMLPVLFFISGILANLNSIFGS